MRLDWQRRAVILFAVALLVLSAVFGYFAVREAERDTILHEKEAEAARRRILETIDGRAKSLIAEAEARVLTAFRSGSEAVPPGLPLVTEVFLVDADGWIRLFGEPPLHLLPGQPSGIREVARAIENDDRWKRAEEAEFRLKDYTRAASLFQGLAEATSDPALKALLLNRLARCYANSGQPERAVAAYRQQLRTGPRNAAAEGIPLGITALFQIGDIDLRRGRRQEAAACFFELRQSLVDAAWPLTGAQYRSFSRLAEDRFLEATREMSEALRADWEARAEDLKQREHPRLARMTILDEVGGRLIPRLRLEIRGSDREKASFRHVAEPLDTGFLLASFAAPDPKTILGLLFDPGALAAGLAPQESLSPESRATWSIAIVDGTGNVIAGRRPSSPAGGDKAAGLQPAAAGEFSESFPPWRIDVYETGPDPAERRFRFKRTIYILSLGAVVAALFFGGFLAIRGTAKELRLARLKSDFAATVSHEFRTPLMSIRYMSELLQRGRIPDEARRQQYYEMITGESERLGRLVENLLDFSKIEAGVKEYRLERTDVAALSHEVAGRFRQQPTYADAVLKTEIADDLPEIQADQDALSRALLNLLDNAAKYSGADPRINLGVRAGEGTVLIEVEDHGIGIPRSEQKRVFEKFYRSEGALKSSVKGSGIGLPLAAHVVRAHGGRIVLESEPGKGTRVTITIPVGPSESQAKGDGHG
jgi:signal transduction histidine kinase/tetratricopeptide (TPR) repeat protein